VVRSSEPGAGTAHREPRVIVALDYLSCADALAFVERVTLAAQAKHMATVNRFCGDPRPAAGLDLRASHEDRA